MKTCLFLCTFVVLSLFVGMNQASKDDGELTDAQLKTLISGLYKLLLKEEEERLPSLNGGWDSLSRHVAAKRVLGSGNLDFVNSDDIRMAVGGSGRRGLGSLGKRK